MESYTIDAVRNELNHIMIVRYADDLEIASALFWYLHDYCWGQTSEEYRALCVLRYVPGQSEHGPEGVAEEIYETLVERMY